MLTLADQLNLLAQYIDARQEPKQRINLVQERYLKAGDWDGTLERVSFTVTTDANGEGFITLPARYEAIRGVVENPTSTAWLSGRPLDIRNSWYEYAPGNLGMIKGSDAMRGVIPVPGTELAPERRYKVPVRPTIGSQWFFTAICKRAFQMLEDDDDIPPIQNLGALKFGLKALSKEDAEDYVRAGELWDDGKRMLAEEKDNVTGPEAYGKIQVDDDYVLDMLGVEEYGWGGCGYALR